MASLNKKPLVVAVVLCLLLGSSGASGSLIIDDWKVAGDHMILSDTRTGYRWLNLTKTAGLTYNQVLEGTQPGGMFEGFTIARGSDVKTLFDTAGITRGSNVPIAPITSLMAKWGILRHHPSASPPGNGAGFLTADFYMAGNPPKPFQCGGGLQDAGISQAHTYAGYAIVRTTSSFDIGTALFQSSPVPEPSAFVLLGMGAVGLLAYAWRRGRAVLARTLPLLVLAFLVGVAHADVFNMPNGLTSLEFVTVSDPGNLPDTRLMSDGTRGYGGVNYDYQIGKYEVTAGQYVQFLNAVAKHDTYGLWEELMASEPRGCHILRSDGAGGAVYSVASDRANRPVDYITFWDACRFVNWLENGQPTGPQGPGTTETGAYTLNGYNGMDGRTIARNPLAKYVLPSENEWYKAAYYKGGDTAAGYWKFATRSDTAPTVVPPPGISGSPGSANCVGVDLENGAIGSPYYATTVGAYTFSSSAFGTFDQCGNVHEWTETSVLHYGHPARVVRGGGFSSYGDVASAWYRNQLYPNGMTGWAYGFRVASVPEPSGFILVGMGAAGLLAFAWRRVAH